MIGNLYDHDPRHWRFARTLHDARPIEDCGPPSRSRWLLAAVFCAVIVALVIRL